MNDDNHNNNLQILFYFSFFIFLILRYVGIRFYSPNGNTNENLNSYTDNSTGLQGFLTLTKIWKYKTEIDSIKFYSK